MTYDPMRDLPPAAGWRAGDVLVVFGELFGRGYAHGIVDAARRAGMTIIGATVGRRDGDGPLRPLTEEERTQAEANLGGRIINVPLEAGFDLEPAGDGAPSPADQLKKAKPGDWETFRLDWEQIGRSKARGARRFEEGAARFAAELEPLLPASANVLFVHTMAGGFPRARVYMPLMTRVFRGVGEKYLPSDAFMRSDLGRLWRESFDEVTARTFQRLVTATARLRTPGRRVRYVAFGYHGAEVLVGDRFTWQTYVPYLQGWAKLELERFAREAWAEGVRCTVFNCPEIWSNSSALFLGVEVALYPLLRAVRAADPSGAVAGALDERCRARLREGATLEQVLAQAEGFLSSATLAPFRDLAAWPQHTTRAQVEAMIAASDALLALSADPKDPLPAELSRALVPAVGRLMFDEGWEPTAPVRWLNHDVIAKRIVRGG
jgi:hypothetical protein